MIDLKVDGMMCDGCARTVEKAVKSVAPEARVTVELSSGKVSVDGGGDRAEIARAIEAAGYDIAA